MQTTPSPRFDPDVLIVGGGAAGIAAAAALSRGGKYVVLLEAKDRLGGRVSTRRVDGLSLPVEDGAEFIHGTPREIMDLVDSSGILAYETDGDEWTVTPKGFSRSSSFGDLQAQVGRVLERAGETDVSFRALVEANPAWISPSAAAEAIGFIEGFHASRAERISARSIREGNRAGEAIEGDRAFKIANGYDRVLEALLVTGDAARLSIRTNARVSRIRWRRDFVEVEGHADGLPLRIAAPRAVVTLPLGVLKVRAGEPNAVEFEPPLPEKESAAKRLEFGAAAKVTLWFRERFWKSIASDCGTSIGHASFFRSKGEYFPTWWTPEPNGASVLVGWVGGPAAERLAGREPAEVLALARADLAALFHCDVNYIDELVVGGSYHDWLADPFCRGAYTYIPVGGVGAPGELAKPVADTLFFAGEATHDGGHHATVHGAIATGNRAAGEVLRSFSRK